MTEAEDRDDLPMVEVHRWLQAERWDQSDRLDELVDALFWRMPDVDCARLRARLRARHGEFRVLDKMKSSRLADALRGAVWECMP